MDTTNALRTPEYLDVLMWLETASEDLITGAYWAATGSVKQDLRIGIQSLMDSDRPALANYFPELVINPIKLDELSVLFPECIQPLKTLEESLSVRDRDRRSPPKGYWAVSAVIQELKTEGKLSPSQSVLLAAELATFRT
ncbi:hypothetical protein I7860_08490 [Pseudomonas tolaasii]|uniref:hypothetical protein n=1 Tax=Pseudomonas tolaasii TaxID=29442 RepID=UPI001C5744FA|nr:hypothetical protein [Pseudomonas tolaasii]MBW1246709.1 hypothetical protein [Pseudomonas tolaasii]